jgi:DNA-binding transcriptional MerR regulator
MSEHIDRLCGDLRIKLHGIDRRLEALKGNAMATSEKAQHAVESQLDRVEQRIYDNRITVEAANARVKAWLDGKKASFDGNRSDWKEHRKVHLLNDRADDAEAYAAAVFELAAAAADEAVQAALEALLARNDANRAALPENWAEDDEHPSRPTVASGIADQRTTP